MVIKWSLLEHMILKNCVTFFPDGCEIITGLLAYAQTRWWYSRKNLKIAPCVVWSLSLKKIFLSRWLRNHYRVTRICPNKMMIFKKKLENCTLCCVIAFAQKDFSHKNDRGRCRRILTAPLSRITDDIHVYVCILSDWVCHVGKHYIF